MTITGAALTGGTAAMTLVATDGEVDGNLTVTDTAGADTITTGDGDDTITVTEVTGKADAVTGDAGTDKLVFRYCDYKCGFFFSCGRPAGRSIRSNRFREYKFLYWQPDWNREL
jgi:hypothetical protein